MAKKSRTKHRHEATPRVEGEVGPRQPCPCGSGRRYKNCHGSADGASVYVGRPFEGLPSECDVVALRELVPSATAPLTVQGTDRKGTLCTLLPMATLPTVRDSGEVWLGLQVQHQFGDPSRDLAAVLTTARPRRRAEPRVAPGAGPLGRRVDLGVGVRLLVGDERAIRRAAAVDAGLPARLPEHLVAAEEREVHAGGTCVLDVRALRARPVFVVADGHEYLVLEQLGAAAVGVDAGGVADVDSRWLRASAPSGTRR